MFRYPCRIAVKMSCRQFGSFSAEGPFNFVSGKRVTPCDSIKTLSVTEPATGNELCSIPASGRQEIDRAVKSAESGFTAWSQLSGTERGQYLTRVSQVISKHVEDIAQLEVLDTGKPIWEARVDIQSCASAFEYFAGVATTIAGQHIKLPQGSFATVQREPLGVVAGIGAWNFPMQTCSWKVAPALACGNSIIYKPSEYTPLTAVVLAEIIKDVGIPDGTYNVVQGDRSTGKLLCEHEDIAKISFTGSVPAGTKVMQSAAETIKKVTLELGGKSPLIIFDDADLNNAIKGALLANFLSQGEVCSNGTRVYVQRKLYKSFTEKLVEATKQLKIGNPYDEKTTVGATIHKEHAEKVLGYIRRAVDEGATIACGGKRVIIPGKFAGGYYLSPCILTNCSDKMTIVNEEVFGSALALMVFDSEEEVVKRANNTKFGLAGGVFTKDIQRAYRVVNKLQAGTIWINTYNMYPPEVPFGGYKMSGLGRENGTTVVDHYTQTKTVYVEMGDIDCGPLCSS